MNAQNNQSKELNSRQKGLAVEQKYNYNNTNNQNFEQKKFTPSTYEQSEQFYEESDQNLNDENPLTEMEDTSFEENNASFLKTFKYKKQSNPQHNDKIVSSEEFEYDDQYDNNKNSLQSDQSHMMSNYIEQLKKERYQIGYKNRFEKKKMGNKQNNGQNIQLNNQKIEKKVQNVECFKEDQTFLQLNDDNRFLQNKTINIKDQKSYQIGTLYQNSVKKSMLNKNDQLQHSNSQSQLNGQKPLNKYNENQGKQIYQNKSDLSNQQFANSKNKERSLNNYQYIHEEKSSDECKSSSSSANNEKTKSQQIQQIKHKIQQLDKNCDQNLISTQEDNYFTLKDNSNLINPVEINTKTNIYYQNENIQQNLQNDFKQISSDNNSQQKNNFAAFNKLEQIISSSNQSKNLSNDQQYIPRIQDKLISDGQSQLTDYTNLKQNQHNGKQKDQQLIKSKSQIQLSNNHFNENEIIDKHYDLQSPLSQLNLFKHSVKANQKSNFQNKNNFNSDNKNEESLSNQIITNGTPNHKSQLQLQAQNQNNLISSQNKQINQQTPFVKESLFGNLNNFEMEFFQKIQCTQVQQYELICDKENKFYQERKRSLEKKYEQMSNLNLKQKEGGNSEQTKKESCLQIIAEKLMLELRMANKVISFLDCQNKYFQKKLEELSLSTTADEKRYLTLSQFVCNNCQSTSFLDREDNLTFIKNAKVSQLSSSYSNQNQNFAQAEQNQYQNSNLIQKIKNLEISKQSHQQSSQQESSLQDDFKNIVSEFNNLKKLSTNLQKQIELLQKENQQLLQKNNSFEENIKQKETIIQQMIQQHEQDKKNLIQEINILTKENCDVRDTFQEQIKQIKLHEAQEFHNLEEKVRQTLLKKDDCIKKLNQIIYELRTQ
ncbi:hypothetical protein ABPG74_015999 [Tetrahymena malaccensis]